jgi:hypothetical protein
MDRNLKYNMSNIKESRCIMVKNRVNVLEKPTKKKNIQTKNWCIFYKERNKIAYLTHEQLKDLLDIDKVKITGKYESIMMEGIERKVWVDGIIKLTGAEIDRLKHEAPKDYLEEKEEGENI